MIPLRALAKMHAALFLATTAIGCAQTESTNVSASQHAEARDAATSTSIDSPPTPDALKILDTSIAQADASVAASPSTSASAIAPCAAPAPSSSTATTADGGAPHHAKRPKLNPNRITFDHCPACGMG